MNALACGLTKTTDAVHWYWTLDGRSLGQVGSSSSVDRKHAKGRWWHFLPLADWQVFVPILILAFADTVLCFRPLATTVMVRSCYIVSLRLLSIFNSDQGHLLFYPLLSTPSRYRTNIKILHPLDDYCQLVKAIPTQIPWSRSIPQRRNLSNPGSSFRCSFSWDAWFGICTNLCSSLYDSILSTSSQIHHQTMNEHEQLTIWPRVLEMSIVSRAMRFTCER